MNKKTKILLSIGIAFLMMSMIGISSIAAETEQTNGSRVTPAVTPDDLQTNDKCIGYTSHTVTDKYGSMYCQVWLYESPHSKRVFWVAELTVNSRNGAVLDGGYNWWSFYDLINNPHVTSTLKFQKVNQNICCISPQNKETSGKAETVTFTIGANVDGGSGDVAWAVNYPEYAQSQTDYTNSVASWSFKDNQALNGGNPTSATYSGAAGTRDVIHGGSQSIDIHYTMCSLTSSYWGLNVDTHSYSKSKSLSMGYIS